MSIIVEVAGMAAGFLSDYSSSKGWGKIKTFLIASSVFSMIFFFYVLIFPSDKGLFVGAVVALGLGFTLGLCTIGFILIHKRINK